MPQTDIAAMIEKSVIEMRNTQKAAVSLGSFNLESIEAGLRELQQIEHLLYTQDNRIFRNPSAIGSAVNWKVVTSINGGPLVMGYCPDGERAQQFTPVTANRTANFCTLGMEVAATWDAIAESNAVFTGTGIDLVGYLNAHLAAQYQARSETWLMYMNKDTALGAAAVASGVASASTNALPAGTYWLRVIPLTKDGYDLGSVANGLVETVTVTPPNGGSYTINGGAGLPGAAMAAGVVAALDDKINWSVADIPGAIGYAWFVGVNATAPADSAMYLQAITTVNAWEQTEQISTTQTLDGKFAVDRSQVDTASNGIFYQNHVLPNGNGYYLSMDGAPLTIDPVGRIVQWDLALRYMFENYGIIPNEIIVATDVHADLSSSAFVEDKSKFRIETTQGDMNSGLVLGSFIVGYRHPSTQVVLPIIADFNSPAGVTHIPTWRHPAAGTVGSIGDYTVDYLVHGGLMKIDWGAQSRRDEFGVYARGTYRSFFPSAFAWICNSDGVTEA
jgi:hypothetical protein